MKLLCLSVALVSLASLPAAGRPDATRDPDETGPPRLDQTLLGEKQSRPVWLGITIGERNDGGGLLVEEVMPESPAANAGLRKGDLLVRLDGRELKTTRALVGAVALSFPDSTMKLELLRNGQTITTEVTLKPRPADRPGPDNRKRMNEAIETLREEGVEPPRGLIKGLPPGHPAGGQLLEIAPEVQLDPFDESMPKPQLEPLQPLLKVDPEWKDGELHLKWNQPTEGKIDAALEEEVKKAIRLQQERIDKQAAPSLPERTAEDQLWRRLQAAVASALEKSGATPEAKEAAARAIQKTRDDWNLRELRRRKLIEEAKHVEGEIKKLRERLERLEKEAQEF